MDRPLPAPRLRRAHDRYALANRQRHRLFPRALLVGLSTGLVAVAFHLALDRAEAARNLLIALAHDGHAAGYLLLALGSVLAVVLAAILVRRLAPEAGGSGIPHVKAVLAGGRPFRWLRVLLVKFGGGFIGIGGGLTLGQEGPSLQMGAALGAAFGSRRGLRPGEARTLVAAGSGAGLAAAFNAPLAGLVFVLEELRGEFASLEFFAAAVASLAADTVCRIALGQVPVFHVTVAQAPDLALLPAFVVLGLFAGLLGVAFNRSLLAASALGTLPLRLQALWWTAVGLALAAVGWIAPPLPAGGLHFLDRLLDSGYGPALEILAGLLALRFVLTVASYSTGAAGGIFAPVLVLGALLGLMAQHLTHQLFPALELEPNAFAVVGMAAGFTGVVRAPLTGIVLMLEMTGNYPLILPLFAASFAALVVADGLHDLPIYEALLERDERRRAAARALAVEERGTD